MRGVRARSSSAQARFLPGVSPRKWFRVEEESMPPLFDPAFRNDALNLIVAVLLGGAIGFERQWRQRLAGLRTNTLVSLGAAIFVVFESQFTDTSSTRVAAGRRQRARPQHGGDAMVFLRGRTARRR